MRSRRLSSSGGGSAVASSTYADPDFTEAAAELRHLFVELSAAHRESPSDSARATLARLRTHIPITLHEVQSGTHVFDWTIPPEWKLSKAYVKCRSGQRSADAAASHLHVVPYSAPVHVRIPLAELRRHIFPAHERLDWMPPNSTRASNTWGFYCSDEKMNSLPEGEYEVCIDARVASGQLTYGECLLRGRSLEEVLISCPLACAHSPDDLSSAAVAATLAHRLRAKRTRYSYRFLFIPGTIGSIAWIALNQPRLFRIKHGLVLTQLGERGEPMYQMSRRGDAEIDQSFGQVLRESGHAFTLAPFSPCGGDERQYCSPGLDLPVGRFMRARLLPIDEGRPATGNAVSLATKGLHDSLVKLWSAIDILEHNRRYLNQVAYCEPQLSKYGLARFRSGSSAAEHRRALLWVLNFSDGEHTLLDVAVRAGLRWQDVKHAANALVACDLLKPFTGRRTDLPRKRKR